MRSVRLRIAVLAIALAGSVGLAAQEGPSGDGRAALREEFLSWRFGMFLHFNMATYIDREWANGYLLNVPPDRSGRISGEHLKRLRELAVARAQ